MKRKPMTWKERTALLALISHMLFVLSYPILTEQTVSRETRTNNKDTEL